jgi:hypothetical protein
VVAVDFPLALCAIRIDETKAMRPLSWLSLAPTCSAAALGAAWAALQPNARLHARDESRTIVTDPETGRSFVPGETATDRTIYNVVGLFCAVVLSVFLGMWMYCCYHRRRHCRCRC